MTTQKERERDQARADLRELLSPGDTVYTILRHVSRSGMTRDLDLYVMQDGEPRRITWSACKATGRRYNTNADAMRVEGCGMDMGFDAVYALGLALWPSGFGCIGRGCPSNDHSNGDRDYTRHVPDGTVVDSGGVRQGLRPHTHWHKSGGYALQHRWL